jgi:hypothetical protein
MVHGFNRWRLICPLIKGEYFFSIMGVHSSFLTIFVLFEMVTLNNQLYNWRGFQCLLDVVHCGIKYCKVHQILVCISVAGTTKVDNVESNNREIIRWKNPDSHTWSYYCYEEYICDHEYQDENRDEYKAYGSLFTLAHSWNSKIKLENTILRLLTNILNCALSINSVIFPSTSDFIAALIGHDTWPVSNVIAKFTNMNGSISGFESTLAVS